MLGNAVLAVMKAIWISGPRYERTIWCTNSFEKTSGKRREGSERGGDWRWLVATPWFYRREVSKSFAAERISLTKSVSLVLSARISFAVLSMESRRATRCSLSTMPDIASKPSRWSSSMPR